MPAGFLSLSLSPYVDYGMRPPIDIDMRRVGESASRPAVAEGVPGS